MALTGVVSAVSPRVAPQRPFSPATSKPTARQWGRKLLTPSVTDLRAYLKAQIDDVKFGVQFAQHSERRVKVQYYILRELEIQLLGGGKGVIPGDHHSAKNHIEHILPQRLSNAKGRTHEWSWARTNPDLHRSLVNRLGNLVILDSDVNRSVESHEFGVKQTGTFKNAKGKISTIKCYKDTALPSAQALSNQTEWKGWTSAEIEQRQKDMAKAAIKVWAL